MAILATLYECQNMAIEMKIKVARRRVRMHEVTGSQAFFNSFHTGILRDKTLDDNWNVLRLNLLVGSLNTTSLKPSYQDSIKEENFLALGQQIR